jgi:hypothetical protein
MKKKTLIITFLRDTDTKKICQINIQYALGLKFEPLTCKKCSDRSYKFGPFGVKTCLLLDPDRGLICLQTVAVDIWWEKAFLISKILKMPCFLTKPEQKDTKYSSLWFKSVNSTLKRIKTESFSGVCAEEIVFILMWQTAA